MLRVCSSASGQRRYWWGDGISGPSTTDGAEIESQAGSTVTFRVAMPAYDAGHIGRHCPACKQLIRMHAGDYAALPDDQRLTCRTAG